MLYRTTAVILVLCLVAVGFSACGGSTGANQAFLSSSANSIDQPLATLYAPSPTAT